jgi:predicted amidophosphoribosyltransferase
MMFCSNCGAELSGAGKFCSRCGFKSTRLSEKPKKDEVITAEPVDGVESVSGTGAEAGGDEAHAPVHDRSCVECDEEASQKCYFCWSNICIKHTKRMQIFLHKAPFGNQVVSCRKCATDKSGKQPTQQEAEGASIFFGVKPYHEWKNVK